MARAVIPPPMCAATVAFPATVADVCFCPASAVRTSFATIDAPDAAFSEGQKRRSRRGAKPFWRSSPTGGSRSRPRTV
jgi:hypothetical protein